MNVFIDTNVLVSAALFPDSVPYRAFAAAVSEPNRGMICEQNIAELKKIFNIKFPEKGQALNTFLEIIRHSVVFVKIPDNPIAGEEKIRDPNDRPIFRAAVVNEADIFLTGDKDFLESGIVDPRILSPAAFLKQIK